MENDVDNPQKDKPSEINNKYIHPVYALKMKKQNNSIFYLKIYLFLAVLILLFSLKSIFFGSDDINSNIRSVQYEKTITKPSIVKIPLYGKIDDSLLEDFKLLHKTIKNNKNIKGVILEIDSPGGSPVSSEMINNIIKKIKNKIPVVSTITNVCASGGYWITAFVDWIVSYKTSIVGSIGMIGQYTVLDELYKKLGIEKKEIRSHELKDIGTGNHVLTDLQRQELDRQMKLGAKIFMDYVIQGRNLTKEEAAKITGGAVYFGEEAIELKLIDAIGDIESAKQWFIDNKGFDKDTPIIGMTVKHPNNNGGGFLMSLFSSCILSIKNYITTNLLNYQQLYFI